ncbi:MAG: PilN domain-containing protein [bacterium]
MVFEINLLPEKYRKKGFKVRLDARVLGVLGGAAAAALIGWLTINQAQRLGELQTEVETLQNQKTLLEPQAQKVDNFRRQIQDLEERITTLQELGKRNQVQLSVLEIISTQVPENVWVVNLNQSPPQGQRGQAAVPAERVLNMIGRTLRKEGLAELIGRLQAQDLIQRVSTNFLRPVRVEGRDVFEFSITAVMNIPG